MIFTTAYCNIGRDQWGELARSHSKYIEHFNSMISNGFYYPLVVYTHNYVIQEMIASYNYPPNIFFCDISGVDTFLKEPYLSNEKEIMHSPEFQTKIPDCRKGCIEHSHPEYTLLTHSKLCFLKHTRSLFPFSPYFAWIDLGYPTKSNICGWPVCTFNPNPNSINTSLLEQKVHIGSKKILGWKVSEEEMLECNYHAFYAFSFIIHNDIFDEFYRIYVEKLTQWQIKGHSDDEQALLYQVYQENPSVFKIFKIDSVWGLFSENLNTGAKNPQIL
jgi:hypothetical protein